MTAAATDVDVVLDERTRDELQPPCESTVNGRHIALHSNEPPCGRHADAIVRATCPRCETTAVLLLCDLHVQRAVTAAARPGICLTCHKPTGAWPCTVEPLR